MIVSRDNEKIKELVKLNNKKFRDHKNLFIVEGYHLVEEAYKAGALKEVYSLEKIDLDITQYLVDANLLNSISNMNNTSIIGVCYKLKSSKLGNKILAIDGVQDPGNLGTIIRSAAAFNFDSILLSENSVDLYNDKVIRATQGLLFQMNIIRCNLFKELELLTDYELIVTDVDDGLSLNELEKPSKFILVMGSEGSGISDEVKRLAGIKLKIKMNEKVESLNVAVAASIIMHHLGDKNDLS